MGHGNDKRIYIIEAIWDPHIQNLEVLNTETPRGFLFFSLDFLKWSLDQIIGDLIFWFSIFYSS